MCGLYGYYELKEASDIERALLVGALAASNEERGDHSYGFWTTGGEPRKSIGAMTHSGTLAEQARCTTVIGHTRFATTGKISAANAHPFRHGSTVGAHNGSIWNWYEIATRHRDRNFSVDSQHLIAHIDEGLPLSDLEGYGAVIWTKDGSEDVYLGTFCNGELAVARVRGGYVFSSDEDHLEAALRTSGLPYKLKRLRAGVAYRLHNGRLEMTALRLDVRYRAPKLTTPFKPREATERGTMESVWDTDGFDERWKARDVVPVDYYLRGAVRQDWKDTRWDDDEDEDDEEDKVCAG